MAAGGSAGQAWGLPRFPGASQMGAGPGSLQGGSAVLMPQMPGGMPSNLLPPPLPSQTASEVAQAGAWGAASRAGWPQMGGFPSKGLQPGQFQAGQLGPLMANGMLPPQMQAQLQGLVASMQAGNPQEAMAAAQAYQAFQQSQMAQMGAAGWRGPMPMGYPAPGQEPSLLSGGQAAVERRPPFQSAAAPVATGPAGAGPTVAAERAAPAPADQRKASKRGGGGAAAAAAAVAAANSVAEEPDSAAGSMPTEVSEMRGQVVQLSKTQAGSKFLQRQLQKGQASVIDTILAEVELEVAQLMCDAYGNYLCSVAFQACSVPQRKRMLQRLSPHVASIACDKRGTHALQALIGLLNTGEEPP